MGHLSAIHLSAICFSAVLRQADALLFPHVSRLIVHDVVAGDPRSFASARRPRIGKILNPNGRIFKISGQLARGCWLARAWTPRWQTLARRLFSPSTATRAVPLALFLWISLSFSLHRPKSVHLALRWYRNCSLNLFEKLGYRNFPRIAYDPATWKGIWEGDHATR